MGWMWCMKVKEESRLTPRSALSNCKDGVAFINKRRLQVECWGGGNAHHEFTWGVC